MQNKYPQSGKGKGRELAAWDRDTEPSDELHNLQLATHTISAQTLARSHSTA